MSAKDYVLLFLRKLSWGRAGMRDVKDARDVKRYKRYLQRGGGLL